MKPDQPVDLPRHILLILVGFCLVHFVFALWYAQQTPFRQAGILRFQGGAKAPDIGAPDERQHSNYVGVVMNEGRFPVLGDPKADPYENYQAHQPPLFYLLASAACKVMGISDPTDSQQGQSLRGFNAIIGAIGVAGVCCFAWWSTRNSAITLGAVGFAALLPMNIALSGAISNDPLLFALCTWALAFLVRAHVAGWCWGAAIRVGLLTGCALLTKTSALPLLLILPVAYVVERKKTGTSRVTAYFLATIALSVLIAAPWWIRNQSLYGDPLALKAFSRAFTGSPSASMFISELGPLAYWSDWVLWWTSRSFVGAFGYMDIFLTAEAYLAFLGVFAILGIAAALPTHGITAQRLSVIVAAGFTALVLASFVRFNMQYFQGQARYLLPAIAPFSLVIGLGLAKLGRKNGVIVSTLFCFALFGLNLYICSGFLSQQFSIRISP